MPRLNDDAQDFERIAELVDKVRRAPGEIVLDLGGCDFLRYNAVAILGGLIRHCQVAGPNVRLDMSAAPKVERFLRGIAFPCGTPGSSYRSSTAIRFFEQLEPDPEATRVYLADEWIGKGRLNVSPGLRSAIVDQVWEVFANAGEHGESPAGVFSCGQVYPIKGEIGLAIVDFGKGIPARVREHLARPEMSGADSLEWAFGSGNSTATTGNARGLGLDLLREFVQMNNGKMWLISGDGRGQISDEGSAWFTARTDFPGTAVCIRLLRDESQYALASEVRAGTII